MLSSACKRRCRKATIPLRPRTRVGRTGAGGSLRKCKRSLSDMRNVLQQFERQITKLSEGITSKKTTRGNKKHDSDNEERGSESSLTDGSESMPELRVKIPVKDKTSKEGQRAKAFALTTEYNSKRYKTCVSRINMKRLWDEDPELSLRIVEHDKTAPSAIHHRCKWFRKKICR